LTTGHRRILVDTPLHQIIRQYLARGRAWLCGCPAVRCTSPADLRRPTPRD
jgi:hypothetical protein